MRMTRRVGAACAAAALTILSATSASADTFYNDLDGTIDSELETMALTYDSVALTGSTGSTIVRMRVDGHDEGDHGGCNIQGTPHYVTITAVSSNTSVAQLTNGPSYTFDACSDQKTVSVLAVGIGSADVTFTVTDTDVSGDPHVKWDATPASFHVDVTESTGGTSTGCDADPAAPAWAAAILQKSGYSMKSKGTTNLISTIANELQPMANFAGLQKGDHPAYENKVRERLVVLTGNSGLASAQSAARPGWTCGSIS